MTQANRILKLLKERGKVGVMNYEFVHLMPPILRYSARIEELRNMGNDITTKKVSKGIFKYILELPEIPEPEYREDIELQKGLFE